MFFLPRSPASLIAFAAIGLILGAAKGRPVWGLLLGALLGPLGWALILAMPRPGSRRPAGSGPDRATWRDSDHVNRSDSGRPGAGPRPPGGCPRCHEVQGPSEKVCRRCGNVLVPVHYEVLRRND